MGLNYVFTIDGDWDEYFLARRSEEERRPVMSRVLPLAAAGLEMAALTGGKFVHFAHTSPLVRDFFLRPEFLELWRKAEASGGEVGVHCHEENLYEAWYSSDKERMKRAIGDMLEGLRHAGLRPRAYRGGFLSFSPAVIPLLEEQGLLVDYSCEPGRHLEINGKLVADWRGAPSNVYRMDKEDHRKPGDSRVLEVPLGIYIERQSLFSIWRTCRRLSAEGGTVIVSVLAHTYDFSSWKMRLKIRAALLICRKYGDFIGSDEVVEKLQGAGT